MKYFIVLCLVMTACPRPSWHYSRHGNLAYVVRCEFMNGSLGIQTFNDSLAAKTYVDVMANNKGIYKCDAWATQ